MKSSEYPFYVDHPVDILTSPLSRPLSVDGGVRRAGDILKAIALGATAVGLGRPLLYGYCAYGAEGVVHAIQILKDEMEMKYVSILLDSAGRSIAFPFTYTITFVIILSLSSLRLIGAPTIADVTPEMVDLSALHNRAVDSVPDHLMRNNYEPLSGRFPLCGSS